MMHCIIAVYLVLMSYMDLKYRRISWVASGVCLVLVIANYCMTPTSFSVSNVLGVGVGVVIAAISLVTQGAIGMGDGIVFGLTGLALGLVNNLTLLCGGLLAAAVCSIVLLCVHRVGRKDALPFVPFICFAYLVSLL